MSVERKRRKIKRRRRRKINLRKKSKKKKIKKIKKTKTNRMVFSSFFSISFSITPIHNSSHRRRRIQPRANTMSCRVVFWLS
jgi:hypothetical protein